MSQTPSFREELISQIPALRLLMAMGYTYLTPLEAEGQRRGRQSNVVLEEVLEPWLVAHNHVAYKGRRYSFSEANVRAAIQALTGEPLSQGLIQANQRVYELLTLGTSLRETIDGDAKSYTHKDRAGNSVEKLFSPVKRRETKHGPAFYYRYAVDPIKDVLANLRAGRGLGFDIPDDVSDLPALLRERVPRGEAVAYICEGMQCKAPVTSLEELRRHCDTN